VKLLIPLKQSSKMILLPLPLILSKKYLLLRPVWKQLKAVATNLQLEHRNSLIPTRLTAISNVVSLCYICNVFAAGELNGLFLIVDDFFSAYQEAITFVKVCFIPGLKIRLLPGKILTSIRILYCQHTFAARWHNFFLMSCIS
jgi:ABC-type multidrug transport system permease subunit